MAFRIESQIEPIPGYRLIERIGRGGFGEVWKAEVPGGLLKAIKFVYGDLQSTESGLPAEQELKALSRVKAVRHPYILSLDRYDVIEGQLLIVMELADRSLRDRYCECRSQNLPGIPREELLAYMVEAAEALDLMNKQYQLQHLDIKPQNIFLVFNHVKVADFGLVKVLEGRMASVTGGITPAYAAPETFDGVVSHFCDQYSLAIVYQELLTGQRPFTGTNSRQLLLQHLQKKPDLSPLPPGDREAIARALAKRSDDRFPTCADLVRALQVQKGGEPGADGAASAARAAHPGLEIDRGPRESADQAPAWPSGEDVRNQETTLPAGKRPARPAAPLPEAAKAPGTDLAPVSRGRPAHLEAQGDGVLFPALVVGLGRQAMLVLKQLRQGLRDRFGTLQALPHLRMLYIDTDPDAVKAAVQGEQDVAFRNYEVLLARLKRPSFYLKSPEGRAFLESWFYPEMLYRIPRVPATAGLRALGRLAFCDHYRLITRRVKAELEACLRPEALQEAQKETGLGLCTNRPRVYVVTHLAGGTGSGMLIDLAFVVRAQLRQLGYMDPNLVGLLLVPAVSGAPSPPLALGNTFAALTELNHFSSPQATFSACYQPTKDSALSDSGPPFGRCVFLPLSPPKKDKEPGQDRGGLAAGFLYRELVTPLGHTAAAERHTLSRSSPPGDGLSWQTFGVHRLCWPRRAMIGTTARRLCERLLKSWGTKDSGPVRDVVKTWAAEQWVQREFGPECLIARLQESCQKVLGKAPEDLFAPVTDPPPVPGRPPGVPDPAAAQRVLEHLEHLVGRPHDDPQKASVGLVGEALAKGAQTVALEWENKLADLAVGLIERPGFRLAGAEEAIRQVSGLLEQTLRTHEILAQELTAKATGLYAALQSQLAPPKKGPGWGANKPAPPRDLSEFFRQYPKARYQGFVLQRVCMIYQSMLANCPEFLQEMSFCRTRLALMVQALEKAANVEPETDLGPATDLFPAGQTRLGQAVDRMLEGITPEDLADLDQRIQEVTRQNFEGLARVCTSSGHVDRDFQAVMQKEVEAFVEKRLGQTSAVDMILGNGDQDQDILGQVQQLYDRAAPGLVNPPPPPEDEVVVTAIPSVPGEDRLQDLVLQALVDVQVVPSDRVSEVVLYREVPQLALADLPQFGPAAREAYEQLTASENFTPHSRTDIAEWLPGTEE